MLRLLRTRRWIGFTALVLGAIIAFGLLSRWQWSRAEERRTERLTIEAGATGPATPLGIGLPAEWSKVSLHGTFLPERQVLVRKRPLDARNGYWVITPMRVTDGRVVWVNRGWLEATGPATSTPPAPRASTEVTTVEGWWRAPEQATPDAGLPAGMVSALDPSALGVDAVSGYLQLSQPQPGLVPVPRPEVDEGRNLSYAAQWLLFALVAVVGWWFFLRREAREDARSTSDMLSSEDPHVSST